MSIGLNFDEIIKILNKVIKSGAPVEANKLVSVISQVIVDNNKRIEENLRQEIKTKKLVAENISQIENID